MVTPPPLPPPREPRFTRNDEGASTLGTVLKVLLWIVGGFVALVVVGTGLILATCAASG